MRKTYITFACEQLAAVPTGMPIYTAQIAKKIAAIYDLAEKEAAAATAVAVKRVLDGVSKKEFTIVQQ